MSKSTAAVLRQAIRSAEALVDQSTTSDGELLRRFAQDNDQSAFAALVRRYTCMVLGVCRRALANVQDAEDACQATFLVLARKSKTGRWHQSVANWLYTTARRIASNARLAAQRRARREARGAIPELVQQADQVTGRELLALLDEELEKLPPRYREPLVLCYLEGLTRDEVAARLGIAPGTVKIHLERGRKKLGEALTKRGCELGGGLLALAATSPARASSSGLVQAVLAAVSATPPAAVAALAREFTMNAVVSKSMVAVLAVAAALVFGLAALNLPAGSQQAGKMKRSEPVYWTGERSAMTGKRSEPVYWTGERSAMMRPLPAAANSKSKPVPADKKDIVYSGRVLGPTGRPVAGAKLYMTPSMGYFDEPAPSPEYSTTGPDGRFEFTVPKVKFGEHYTVVAAAAANHGLGWVRVSAGAKTGDLTIRLVKDDGPITGRIVDLEGKPIRGATLRVLQINSAPGEDLGPWLEAARNKKGDSLQLEQKHLPRFTIALSPKATTDARGRFRLDGIGRNRLVRAQLDGPTIASQRLCILTRPGKPIVVTKYEGNPEYGEPRVTTTYYGADFQYAAAPGQLIAGVVRDKDTKKPLAGVTIRSYSQVINPGHNRRLDIVLRATTDAKGRYRLTGMPKGKGYQIAAVPGADLPYLPIHLDVPNSVGLEQVTVDVELKRGVWIAGRMTDKVTGKPLQGSVEYFSLWSNPNLGRYPGFDGTILMDERIVAAKEDGSYRIVGLPGPGLVCVYYQQGSYLRAPDREGEFSAKERSMRTSPYIISFTSNYSALARVNPENGVDKVSRDVTLDPGWKFTGTVQGPEGKPLAGVRKCDLNSKLCWERERMKSADFTSWFNPRYPRDVLFQLPEKGLIGVARPPKEKGGSVTVRMIPGASVTGRLVDADGKPRAGVELKVTFRPPTWGSWFDYSPERIETDREGRFRVAALVPGYEFRLSDGKGELKLDTAFRSGQKKDLGDVRMNRAK